MDHLASRVTLLKFADESYICVQEELADLGLYDVSAYTSEEAQESFPEISEQEK